MSRFSGKQYPGASRVLHEVRRDEADARAKKTKSRRRRAYRLAKQAKAGA